jgi:hypothetical protein
MHICFFFVKPIARRTVNGKHILAFSMVHRGLMDTQTSSKKRSHCWHGISRYVDTKNVGNWLVNSFWRVPCPSCPGHHICDCRAKMSSQGIIERSKFQSPQPSLKLRGKRNIWLCLKITRTAQTCGGWSSYFPLTYTSCLEATPLFFGLSHASTGKMPPSKLWHTMTTQRTLLKGSNPCATNYSPTFILNTPNINYKSQGLVWDEIT